ncbi:MAG: 2-amino-4-hydroxy-6-hydroxymethyldihydropteridine diphosphokinase [Bacteroidales bacterium]|jgi:2-amino-4-hydroxy-6-hydroxymethyldihydropteridine diphosphokinase|nr:2-amino-4-hydroxy-6-hydroxymethyldihydropteridine diphosphokinase [Bacteroidales bacterium]
MEKTTLSLGSNIGDREHYLQQARALIGVRVGRIERASSVRETDAWGFDAEPFLNQVIVVNTNLAPFSLLETLQTIEQELGRTQKTSYENNQPIYHDRTIDIDILYYGDQQISTETLTIPHLRLAERTFFKEMLTEIQ